MTTAQKASYAVWLKDSGFTHTATIRSVYPLTQCKMERYINGMISNNRYIDSIYSVIEPEALLQTFASKNWWAGGFVWKWFPQHSTSGGEGNTGFTPQNKMAEAVLQSYFTKNE